MVTLNCEFSSGGTAAEMVGSFALVAACGGVERVISLFKEVNLFLK